MPSERKAWDRIPGETRQAYTAFCIYRNMGPRHRSIRAAAEEYFSGKKTVRKRLLEKWSSEHGWVRRCEAYDEFIDEQKRQAYLDEVLAMATRQAQIGTTLQTLGAKILNSLMVNEDGTPKDRITGNVLDAVRASRVGAEIERLARGMPTQIIEEQEQERDFLILVGLDELDDEE